MINNKSYRMYALAASCVLGSALCSPLYAQSEDEAAAPPKRRQIVQENVQKVELTGKVLDAATGTPLVGVQIQAYNNPRYSAMTDDEGAFTIKVPDYTTSLTYACEGYNLVQAPVGKSTTLAVVKMYADKFAEIYSRKTSATSSKTANVTYNNNDFTVDNQIQQNFGGDMLTNMRSGVAGQGVMMLMNGLNSLNANAQPLVIVDGVIQNMQYGSKSLHDGFFNNILTGLMVEDIEKISVLKNGTAIYGAKGANGVVVIETKRNKSMATRIDVSIGGTYELIPRLPEMMNSEQYRIYSSELIGTTGTKSNSFKYLQTDPDYFYYNMYHNNTDWTKETYRQAFVQNYSINVQGGDDVANYNLSVGYAGGNATLECNDYSRFNLRLNTDINLVENVKVRFDASYSDVKRNLRDDAVKENVTDGINSAPGFLSLIKSPFLSPYAYDSNGHISGYLAPADDYLSDVSITSKTYTKSLANPVSILRNGDGDNKNYFGNRMVSLAVTPQWDINKDFSVADHFAFQLVNTDENYYLPTTGVPSYYVTGLGTVQNTASALAARQISIMNDLYGTYRHRFGAHHVDARVGFRYLRDTYRLNAQYGYNTGNDKTPNMSASLTYKSTDGDDDRTVNLTYYLNANYNYLERYYLSVAASLDGSSRFGVDAADGVKIGNYAFGFFPSVEAAWVATNEKWFRPNKGVNYLRVNVGYDVLGNDDMNAQASRTYFVAKRLFDVTTGLSIGNIGNTSLQWETTRRFTAGFQIAGLENRVNLSFNYFKSTTDNLLSLNALSYITGLSSNWNNNGKLGNEGFDVALNVKVLNLKDWTWSVGGSIGHYKNKIKRLSSSTGYVDNELYGATIRTQVGGAANMFYGYKTDGVFATQADADKAGVCIQTETGAKKYFKAGDMKFVDENKDGIINEKDMQIIGDPNPDIYGTINTQLTWKKLTFSAQFTYSLGGDIYNYQRSILESGSYFYNQTTALLNRWTHEGQVTDIPRANFLDEMGNSRFSDRWIEDGSYLKLKNITVSYDIPVRNAYLQGITVWGAANNLFTVTKYLGSDPEFAQSNSVIGMGIDRGMLGQGRSFSLGVKVKL